MKTVTLDESLFDRKFPDYGFGIRHELAASSAFELPRLVELARTLPTHCVEYNAGNLAPDQEPSQTPDNGLSVTETIERIENCQSWLVLKHVEQVPEYRALLDACLDEIYPHAQRHLSGLHERAAFIFVTSPGSVTPFHFDPEHNFLLQVRGEKTMHQFDQYDRSILPESAIEEKYVDTAAHRNQPFRDEFQAKAETFTLQAGDGLFVPINSPHWVQNGNEVSVSFSITFRSRESERTARLHRLNGVLRSRLGITPSPLGSKPLLDDLKYGAIQIWRTATAVHEKLASWLGSGKYQTNGFGRA